jgi:hypothetical protein
MSGYKMNNYTKDKEFSDFVHQNLAVKIIYDKFNWVPQNINRRVVENVDIFNGVDRFFVDVERNKIITVQERFREEKYQYYSDFTIRYKRDFNKFEERKLSEFFKLEADFFVYGVINTSKINMRYSSNFIKYAVIDINVLKKLFNESSIIIDENLQGVYCKIKNEKLVCPIIFNRDKSSSFIPIDIVLLKKIFRDEKVLIESKGY